MIKAIEHIGCFKNLSFAKDGISLTFEQIMQEYLHTFIESFTGSIDWTWRSIIFEVPWYTNYFWGLIVVSLVVWILEILFPWRKEQAICRKDFWLDVFYMFFNFFIFSIIISGFYSILELTFTKLGVEITSFQLISLASLPSWAQLLIFFVLLDFVQ